MGSAQVLESHCCSSTQFQDITEGSKSPWLGGDLGSSFSQMVPIQPVDSGSEVTVSRNAQLTTEVSCPACAGAGRPMTSGPCPLPPAGSVGSASSHACKYRPPCAHYAACPSTPRRWTRPPRWKSSSHPIRHPAGAATRRYPTPRGSLGPEGGFD